MEGNHPGAGTAAGKEKCARGRQPVPTSCARDRKCEQNKLSPFCCNMSPFGDNLGTSLFLRRWEAVCAERESLTLDGTEKHQLRWALSPKRGSRVAEGRGGKSLCQKHSSPMGLAKRGGQDPSLHPQNNPQLFCGSRYCGMESQQRLLCNELLPFFIVNYMDRCHHQTNK